MASWIAPVVDWQPAIDTVRCHRELTARGLRLSEWPPLQPHEQPTDCFRIRDAFWICQPGVGAVAFRADHPALAAHPDNSIDRAQFEYLIVRSWLPAVYQCWGRQVLHASAVAHRDTGQVIAFVGPGGAGKSTLAFGLGRRSGWQQVADDTLAFSTSETGSRPAVILHPLANESRLRPATAEHFGRSGHRPEEIDWPAGELSLRRLYVLAGETDAVRPLAVTPLGAAETYRVLLEQAHAMTLALPDYNQQLMRDYLRLAAAVPAFRLAYRKTFHCIDDVFEAIETHAREEAGSRRGVTG